MRIRNTESGPVIEQRTAPPPNGLYCARDEHGVPVTEAGRLQEPPPAPKARKPKPIQNEE
jgi:hypothetical protein